MHHNKRTKLLVGLAAAMATVAGQAMPASAATATEVITGTSGTLTFVSGPASPTFPPQTSGASAVTSTVGNLEDVNDARGTGVGWNITLSGTNFTSGSNSIAVGNVSVAAQPAVACDSTNSCTPPVASGLTFPWTMTGSAQKIANASANTGMGTSSQTPSFTLTIPGGSVGGTYTSTWTYTLNTVP